MSTVIAPTYNSEWDKSRIKDQTKEMLKEIGDLQYKMLAENRRSIIIVLQGIDASGKDGLTRKLLKYCNPVGIETHAFRKPTEEEYAHDFLWRVHRACPRSGIMKVFIRSHYEDILVPSVEKYIPEEIIDQRYNQINVFEKLLADNGTIMLKFFLNVSREEQKRRLLDRVFIAEKHWKHKDGDWNTREKFDEYVKIYGRILDRCNYIPWHVVPADSNWQKLYAVADIVLKTLRDMNIQWPPLVTSRDQEWFSRQK
jgi:PPK2 family polyphosphate:nucleotide phosphotransferase